VVKKAAGRFAAECLPIASSQRLIRETEKAPVVPGRQGSAPQVDTPVHAELGCLLTDGRYGVLLPGAPRLDGRKLAFEAEDMLKAYLAFRGMVTLAAR
jgi:D-aminopeptidase